MIFLCNVGPNFGLLFGSKNVNKGTMLINPFHSGCVSPLGPPPGVPLAAQTRVIPLLRVPKSLRSASFLNLLTSIFAAFLVFRSAVSLEFLLCAVCSLLSAACSLQCSLLSALCCLLSALCSLPPALQVSGRAGGVPRVAHRICRFKSVNKAQTIYFVFCLCLVFVVLDRVCPISLRFCHKTVVRP